MNAYSKGNPELGLRVGGGGTRWHLALFFFFLMRFGLELPRDFHKRKYTEACGPK